MRCVSAAIAMLLVAPALAACSPPREPDPTAAAPAQATPTAIASPTGTDLRQVLYDLDAAMPRAGTEGYRGPTQAERESFAALLRALPGADASAADALAAALDYTARRMDDAGEDGARSTVLQEREPIQKGWGLYVLRLAPTNNIIIEAPHPLSDVASEQVALDVYRALHARALLVAGAHRDANADNSADAAHSPDSMFEMAHETLLSLPAAGGQPIILQIHGFASEKHVGYPAVVLGIGRQPSAGQATLAGAIVSRLRGEGLSADVCDADHWNDVCGFHNVQAASAARAVFIHVELDDPVRKTDDLLLAALVAALTAQ